MDSTRVGAYSERQKGISTFFVSVNAIRVFSNKPNRETIVLNGTVQSFSSSQGPTRVVAHSVKAIRVFITVPRLLLCVQYSANRHRGNL